MCGIAGLLHTDGQPVDPAVLRDMANALAHRGPDDSGVWQNVNVGVAHRRLAIVDLAGGHQPMTSADGTTTVVFNGEIYNHLELRRQLQAAGREFRTNCDTEVLLHLYEQHGTGMLDSLEGMFAFAIVDTVHRKLLLGRDRFGQKPLFYCVNGKTMSFASELQALRRVPGFDTSLNLQSIHDYLTFQYVPGPDTVFHNVKKLPPGSCLILDLDSTPSPRPKTYWQLDAVSGQPPPSFADAKIRLRELLTEAVRKRLMSDVPLGAFLSGGLDSTIIAGLMARAADHPVKTCTVGFEHTDYDERAYATLAARHAGTDHVETQVDALDFEALVKLVRHCGEPYADSSILPTFLLSRFTRQHVTVALSGDGADELFGGYYRYVLMNQLRVLDCLPRAARRSCAKLLKTLLRQGPHERCFRNRLRRAATASAADPSSRYLAVISRVTESGKRSLYGSRLRNAHLAPSDRVLAELSEPSQGQCPAAQCAWLDLHSYLPGDILTKVDIASMACSLEVRNPFLDHHVAEFALSLPWQYKQRLGERKRILSAAFADLLPTEIQRRGKMGFGVPLAAWFRTTWLPILHDTLLDATARQREFFDANAISAIIAEHASGKQDHSYLLFSLLMLELWQRECLD